MDTIALGSSGRSTTRLGFGSSSILGALSRRQSLALLESAFDAGIRHFDTAPMYGYGEAEGCVGEFLNRHRGAVTITTKFGIAPSQQSGMMRAARGLARPILQRFPAIKKRLQQSRIPVRVDSVDVPELSLPNPIFCVEDARCTLENSLRRLRTDRIDVWLLHDVKSIDLDVPARSEPLLRFMQEAVSQGKVGTFGIGSDRDKIPALLDRHLPFCPVAQYEWSLLAPVVQESNIFRIHHRALRQHFHPLANLLEQDSVTCRRWSEAVGQDLQQPGTLARTMLKAAYLLNPGSILLFSSKSAEHIRENVANTQNASMNDSARRFYALLQSERSVLV
jgi:D-threo-aldose 1-dehydrogenase